jgi:hypothetical protein
MESNNQPMFLSLSVAKDFCQTGVMALSPSPSDGCQRYRYSVQQHLFPSMFDVNQNFAPPIEQDDPDAFAVWQ